MTASDMGEKDALEKAMQEFWDAVYIAHSAIAELEETLIIAQKPPNPETDGLFAAEEKVRNVRNVINERLSHLEAGSGFAKKSGQDHTKLSRQAADSLMDSLPCKWQEAESALASVSNESVTEAWETAKVSTESLMQKWEELGTT